LENAGSPGAGRDAAVDAAFTFAAFRSGTIVVSVAPWPRERRPIRRSLL